MACSPSLVPSSQVWTGMPPAARMKRFVSAIRGNEPLSGWT